MTSERRTSSAQGVLLAALLAGCPASSRETRSEAKPDHLEVDVSEAEILTVRCGSTSSRIVDADLENELRRCEAQTPIHVARLLVDGIPSAERVIVAADTLEHSLREASASLSIEGADGIGAVEYRPWDVCYVTSPPVSCGRVFVEVLPDRLALETSSSSEGPCASPRKLARPYGETAPESTRPIAPERTCHVDPSGTTREQLLRLKRRIADIDAQEELCSIGTVAAHRDVPWPRVASVAAEVHSWTGEPPAIRLLSRDPRARLLGCDESR